MRKKIFRWGFILVLLSAFAYTLYFLYEKDQEKPVTFTTDSPTTTSIYRKTVATGSILPREEVAIKPRVSGVIQQIYVEAGQMVKKGQKLALIKIIPNVIALNNAENRLKSAEINLKNQKVEIARQRILLEKKVIAESEFQRIEASYELAKEELDASARNLDLVREGALKGSGNSNNLVVSTVEGMVLDLPVKEGSSVIESNNFNEGTTIVLVANMNDMIFEGNVDESEVGKLKVDMPINIKVGAIENHIFAGKLEFISPKGVEDQGTIQFQIKASVEQSPDFFIRAGYSANAEIVLEKRENVLALKESLLLFEDGKTLVELETAPQVFEKREVKTGLSDGLQIEIISGLSLDQKVKVQEAYGMTYK